MSGTYFLLNAIFVVVVFTLQMNVDKVSIPWPIGDGLKLEPIGLMFLIFFAIIMLVQVIQIKMFYSQQKYSSGTHDLHYTSNLKLL